MATFEERVETITGETIASTHSSTSIVKQSELTQYLIDAVLDITNRWIATHPNEAQLFTRSSAESESNSGLGAGISHLISVVRETGTDNDWRGCRQVPLNLQSRVTDINSIHYASKYNPAFVRGGDGSVLVYPVPAGSNNAYKIYYVNDVPVNSSDASLIFSHSDLNYFPKSLEHLVPIKASISVLESYMNSRGRIDADISTALSAINTAIDQASAAADKFIAADADSTFGDESTFLTDDSQLTRVKNALDNAEKIIDDGANSPTGNAAGDAASYLYDEEDLDLVQGAIAIASTEIQRAQGHLAEWTAIGGMRTQEIQAALSEAVGYAQEVKARSSYTMQVMQEYTAKIQNLKRQYDESFLIERMGGAKQAPAE
mgnify:CR=1 FL=1